MSKVDTAALRRFADNYQACTQKDLRAAGLPAEGSMAGPWTLIREVADELTGLRAENERLRKIVDNCKWYWDAADRECSSSSPYEILDEVDWGQIVEIDRGGVVETKFYFRLPPDEGGDNDEDFDGEYDTLEEAQAALKAEQDRRAAFPDPLAQEASDA